MEERLKTVKYKRRLIWKYVGYWVVEGYGRCRTLRESKDIINNNIWNMKARFNFSN